MPALTGLRIFAALAVYLSHIGPPHDSPKLLATFVSSGYSGVTIFFVLSGFVLAINYFENLRTLRPGRIYNYFVARFARIYPLYILILLYIVVRQHAFGESIEGWERNALAIQAWDPNIAHAYSFDAPAWSISVEFFLYACFPLLILPIGRLRSSRGILIAAAGVAALMAGLAAWFVLTGKADLSALESPAHRWLYRTPLTRLGDFALGILAARLFAEVAGKRILRRIGPWLAGGVGVLILALMAWPALFLTAWSLDVAYAIPAVVLIFGLAVGPRGWLARALSLPFIVLLGEASYAFYLVHSPAIGFFGAGHWATGMSPTALVYELLTLGAILALAVGLHLTVELPCRKHLRRWLSKAAPVTDRRRESNPPAQAPAA